ncbi:MAG: TetR/AcrR family transcriptional regulator [Marinobacterium sp.]|nr:TetR/AcrR family transcriptional regulator [Marinobacterium sp.]
MSEKTASEQNARPEQQPKQQTASGPKTAARQKKGRYHHGDLRQTLLACATQLIREAGVEGLSMRKLADLAGVSRTAPYHHFSDKRALLSAIAEQGFIEQADQIEQFQRPDQTPPSAEDSRVQFERYITAYIRFAAEQPETYDLMFGKAIWKGGMATESLQQVSRQSFQRWRDWIAQLQQQGLLPEDHCTLRVAQASWATLHGLCRLLNDGVYMDRDNLEQMGRTAAALLLK